MQEKLHESEEEVASLRRGSVWKNKLEKEKREASKLQDRLVRYKANLSDRDQEIRGLKEAMSNANKSLSEENERLKAEMTRMTKERTYLEDNLKELDLRCQSLEEDVRRVKAAKAETEVLLGDEIKQMKGDIAEREKKLGRIKNEIRHANGVKDDLNAKIASLSAEMSSKDDQIAEISEHLHRLHLQHVELIASADVAHKLAEELRSRIKELEVEVERKQENILEGAEENEKQ
ncbi:hypothetical protein DH2020_044080 [Rehmannia glutinosa]|uniref:Myosin tail domain-containing protein n=1 Tax=Rehmannia glutinosa TaxID=99300 RepID=A0ABR0UIS2_REHGL